MHIAGGYRQQKSKLYSPDQVYRENKEKVHFGVGIPKKSPYLIRTPHGQMQKEDNNQMNIFSIHERNERSRRKDSFERLMPQQE